MSYCYDGKYVEDSAPDRLGLKAIEWVFSFGTHHHSKTSFSFSESPRNQTLCFPLDKKTQRLISWTVIRALPDVC